MPLSRRTWMRGSRLVSGLGILGAALALLAGALLLSRERSTVYERQASLQQLLARVLEDHATRSLDTAFLALGNVADPIARGAAPEVVQALLTQTQASLPQLRGVALLDESGLVLAAADPGDRRQRIPLQRLGPWPQATREGGTAIGPVLAARNLAGLLAGAPPAPKGVAFIALLRAVNTGSGQRLLLVGLLNPDTLANFQQVTLGDAAGAAALLRLDGEVLAATAEVSSAPGTRLAQLPALAEVEAGREHGAWWGLGLRGQDQSAAFRALPARPLLVVVETEHAALEAAWWSRSRGLALLTGLAALALLALTRAAYAALRSREKARSALDQAQQRIADSEKELRAQLGLARSLLVSSPLPMSVLDRQGRYLDVNHAWESFTGRQRRDVIGQPVSAFQTEQAATLHAQQDGKLLRRGGEVRYESVWSNAEGQPRDLYINKSTFPGPDGKPAGIVVCFMDISEFREAERLTRAARDAALEASQAKSEFIANVSHELRTPLQSIIGFSELGMHRSRENARLTDMFGDIHRSGERMLALVNDLLDLSKIESPIERLEPTRQDLRPLLMDVAAELHPQLEARRQSLQLDMPEDELIALIDPPRFAQVIRNLLANAIKFGPEGSAIELRAFPEAPQRVRIEVGDRGPGIPPTELEKIFEAFVQSSRTKDGSGGTGLGLAICRRLVEAHGGRIAATNRPGGGALLSLWLPAARFGDTQPLAL